MILRPSDIGSPELLEELLDEDELLEELDELDDELELDELDDELELDEFPVVDPPHPARTTVKIMMAAQNRYINSFSDVSYVRRRGLAVAHNYY